MLLIIIAVVVFLLFVTAIIFSVRSWKWFHITMCFFVYVTANLLVVQAARSLKPRMTWMNSFKKHEVALKKARDMGSRLANGELTEVTQTEPNVRMLEAKIDRVTTGRGRVWRNLSKDAISEQQVVLKGATPEPLGFADQLQAIVYLFRETAHNELKADDEGQVAFTVPTCFLGEFKVSAAAGNQVTLVPTHKRDANMLASITAATSLVLYETMPIDGHRLFSLQDSLIEPVNDEQKPLFGPMEKAELDKVFLMAASQSFLVDKQIADPDDLKNRVADLNKNYLRDGKVPLPTDDQEREIWMKVRFIKEPPTPTPVDSEEEQLNFLTRPFDTNGRAISSRLRRGEDVKFNVDDIAVFHREKALELIDDGFCEQIHQVYVRPLNDYEHVFHRIDDRKYRIAEEEARVVRDTQKVVVTDNKIKAQITFREAEKTALDSDLQYHKRDLTEIEALEKAVKDKHDALVDELAALHVRNRFLAAEIARIDKVLRERVEGAAEPAAVGSED